MGVMRIDSFTLKNPWYPAFIHCVYRLRPNVALSEAICPSCQYTEWVGQLRAKNQLPCVNCGTQMTPAGNSYHGEPPGEYFEVQCPRRHHHQACTLLYYDKSGQRFAHGRASSKDTEARNTVASSKRRPTICKPTGKLSLVKPTGMLAAG